jgi:transcriptional regulator with XRE-family HTH domain
MTSCLDLMMLSLVPDPDSAKLGATLRSKRRAKRLTLRALSDEIGVSFNALSRVERGHVPDLKNFNRIVQWLELPSEHFLAPASEDSRTPQVIARHLRSDTRLSEAAAAKIASLVEEMYWQLVNPTPQLTVHLRSAQTFTPAAGAQLAEILADMQSALMTE